VNQVYVLLIQKSQKLTLLQLSPYFTLQMVNKSFLIGMAGYQWLSIVGKVVGSIHGHSMEELSHCFTPPRCKWGGWLQTEKLMCDLLKSANIVMATHWYNVPKAVENVQE
jgi:hypothetical protein